MFDYIISRCCIIAGIAPAAVSARLFTDAAAADVRHCPFETKVGKIFGSAIKTKRKSFISKPQKEE